MKPGQSYQQIKKSESSDMERAKAADLIGLPKDVKGTNCGNCRFFSKGHCENKKVNQDVTDRQCCIYWDAEGVIRPWEKK